MPKSSGDPLTPVPGRSPVRSQVKGIQHQGRYKARSYDTSLIVESVALWRFESHLAKDRIKRGRIVA